MAQPANDAPPGVRQRIQALLKLPERNQAGVDPRLLATRVLEYMAPAK